MDKNPYDSSTKEQHFRNENQLKEELASYEAHIQTIERHLNALNMSMDEVRTLPSESEAIATTTIPPKKKRRPASHTWLRL
jgi:chaperonin cofactor prefoldin